MKKIIFLLILINSFTLKSQWADVGNIINTGTGKASMKLDKSGVLHVAYQYNSLKASVVKYTNGSWGKIGTSSNGFSDGEATAIDLVFDNNNVPYVAYRDVANGQKISIKKFDGDWVDVSIGFSSDIAFDPKIAFNSNNELFVAFTERITGSNNAVSVMKYNGTSWDYVGIRHFSGISSYLAFAIDNEDKPYVCFGSFINSNSGKASVMKFNGSSWEYVGNQGFSSGYSRDHNIAFDNSNSVFVAFNATGTNGGDSHVMKFNGTNWEYIGEAGMSTYTNSQSLFIDSFNEIYLGYKNTINNQIEVKKFSNSNWELLGGTFVDNVGNYPVITKSSNSIYVNYSQSFQVLAVKKYQDETASLDLLDDSNLFNMYPNPANNMINLKSNKLIDTIEIYNLLGKKILVKKINNQQKIEIDVSNLSKGIYVVKAKVNEFIISKKLIID